MIRLVIVSLSAAALALPAAAQPLSEHGPRLVGSPFLTGFGEWVDAPSNADIQAAKPPGVAERAYVSLSCKVDGAGAPVDCQVGHEEPRGVGLAAAARKLASRFRLDPKSAELVRTGNFRAHLQISWHGEGGACLPPLCIPHHHLPPPRRSGPPAPPR